MLKLVMKIFVFFMAVGIITPSMLSGKKLMTKKYERVVYTASDDVYINPYMGYAGWAVNMTKKHMPEPDVSLAFALLFWKDFEPEKGVYDFDSFEELNNFQHLTSKNVKIIIRFVCDYPSTDKHMDIPEWLFDEIDGAGQYYNNNGLQGFAPDYANEYIIKRHDLAIKTLGERYGNSPDVAFIQLGSLGQWGEWHNTIAGISFPDSDITDLYVKHYLNAFKEIKLQMRRPNDIAKENGIGFYNDMMGNNESTYMWLGWIEDFGVTDYYSIAPSGGEFASTYPLEKYFNDMYENVKKMMIDSHTTYIVALPQGNDNSEDLLKTIGYRLMVENVHYSNEIYYKNTVSIMFNIKNAGIAPFYYKWPFRCFFFNENGEMMESQDIDLDVTKILPGNVVYHYADIFVSLEPGDYTIKLGLINPYTGNAEVMFANIEMESDCLLPVGNLIIKEK